MPSLASFLIHIRRPWCHGALANCQGDYTPSIAPKDEFPGVWNPNLLAILPSLPWVVRKIWKDRGKRRPYNQTENQRFVEVISPDPQTNIALETCHSQQTIVFQPHFFFFGETKKASFGNADVFLICRCELGLVFFGKSSGPWGVFGL